MDSLYLYGGEYSWKPPAVPDTFSTWEYSIADSSWIEHSSPATAAGNSAPDGDVPVQRAAEGAGVNVPSLGRGYYFGGHLDGYTTPGWDQSIPRVYLQSLLEYTFPGNSNNEVNSLKSSEAGSAGVYRNITDGGQQAEVGFTERADGILIYVPGFGAQGILLALAGGTNETYVSLNDLSKVSNSADSRADTNEPDQYLRHCDKLMVYASHIWSISRSTCQSMRCHRGCSGWQQLQHLHVRR